MVKKNDLLIEIGLEELPHEFVLNGVNNLSNSIVESLKRERIDWLDIKSFSTPRRIALLIKDVNILQSDCNEEKRGPSLEKAFTGDKKPTKALLGFLRSNNVKIEDTVVRSTGNGRYVFLIREVKGKKTIAILPEILKKSVSSLNFPKSMKWEESSFMFARPIRWILFLFGSDVIQLKIADVESSNYTFGHRAYSQGKIFLKTPSDYEEKLLNAFVIPDREARKNRLINQIKAIVKRKGLKVPDGAVQLYDTNTDLTELPAAVLCRFDKHYLELPQEVLTSEMIEHQKYFPLVWRTDGKLSNYFIAVSNIKDNTKTRYGYENVLKARLDDGEFFYNEDKKKDFSKYLNNLEGILFHKGLGSMFDKVNRIKKISLMISDLLLLKKDVRKNIEETVNLCKNDLATLMVQEFPNLQGIMGYYHAIGEGYSENVALGIKEHYYPRYANDQLPLTIEGAVVGIADRLDTIVSIFSIGLKPKGSKDPFGLRRAVLAIIRVIIGLRLNLSIKELIDSISSLYSFQNDRVMIKEMEDFFKNRIKTIFGDMGFSYDEIDASLSNVLIDIYEAYRRVAALHEIRGERGFNDLLVSFKRMSNIVKDEKDYVFSEDLLKEDDEIVLYQYFSNTRGKIVDNIKNKQYKEVYRILSTFKPYVDNFFDNVLVMEENLSLRRNRIRLLKDINGIFSGVIDFSRIVVPGE